MAMGSTVASCMHCGKPPVTF